MEELYKKDIEIYKKEIERLYKKIDYLKELDRKNFLQLIKLQNKITDYDTNFIEYYKYEELQNDYWQLQQCYNYELNKNKNKEANNE